MSFMLAACPGAVGPTPDPDAPPLDDTSLPGNGVTIEFEAPALPILPSRDVLLEQAMFKAMTIRALGDVASDARTTRDNVDLVWRVGGEPMSITFDQAPTGMYSTVSIRITQLELLGEAEADDNDRDFDIEADTALIDAVVDVPDTSLEGGGTVKFTINVDLGSMIAGIDWDNVRVENGELTIEDGDPEMPAIQAAVDAAFRP